MASAGAASIPENPNPIPDPNPPPPTDGEQPISKKAAKKLAAKLEKQKRQGESAAASAAAASAAEGEDDPLSGNYGDLPLSEIQSKEEVQFPYTSVDALGHELKDSVVLVRGTAQTVRAVGKKMAFIVLRDGWSTVQCVVAEKQGVVSKGMVKFVAALSRESVVDVEGVISVPDVAITGATQQVEIQVTKLYCISKASPNLPFNLEDAARSDAEIEEQQLVRVNQDTRLNFRYFDLRTPANQAIFQIQSEVSRIFGDFLRSEGFREIHTPKLIAGSSEGGSAVFHLDYKGQAACLAQSPQLHKQMAIAGRFRRVFEIGPVFRAEDSFTHRHLCEFTGLDVEMEIKKHYFEVMDIVDRLFVKMFNTLKSECSNELEAIARQYPFEPLKYLEKTLRLPFQEGIEMLKADGVDVDPLGDLNTATERRLGQLVREKYGTDFYILYRYPLAVRPFYTMPCYDDSNYSNSFDVFIRGEEIISGAQRVHVPELLTERAQACGIDVNTIKTYIDAFRYGTPPHGGFGVGLERVVMLYCALNNIRKASLFPRDPTRLAP